MGWTWFFGFVLLFVAASPVSSEKTLNCIPNGGFQMLQKVGRKREMSRCEVVILSSTQHRVFKPALEKGMCLIVVVFGDEEDSPPSYNCKRWGKERVWMCGRLMVVKELSLNSTLKYQILNKQVLKTLLPLFFPSAKIVGWIDEERRPQYTLERILEFFQDNQTMMVVPEHPGGPRFLRDEVRSGGRKRGFWDKTTTAGVLSNFTEKGWAGLPVFDTGLRFQRNVPLTQKFSCDWFEQIESGLSTQDQLYLTPMLHMNGIDTFPSLKVIPADRFPLYYRSIGPKKTLIERCPYLPTHVLLGSMKSGTSTIFEMLKQCTPLCYGRKDPMSLITLI